MQEMQETRVWSLGQEDPPEQKMAPHSSIFAWKISYTKDPGGLQYTGLQSWIQLSEDAHTTIA